MGSGVFDLENIDGPEVVRDREPLGVEELWVATGGGALEEEARSEDDKEGAGAACEGGGTGTDVGAGAGADMDKGLGLPGAAASFVCRLVTLRLRDSIFELSFFFSLMSLQCEEHEYGKGACVGLLIHTQ